MVGFSDTITWQQQQDARGHIAQLEGQKQQLQNQISANNNLMGQKTGKMLELALKLGALQMQHGTSSGIPTDIEAGINMASMAAEIKTIKKEIESLQTQNQNLQSQADGLDSQIIQQQTVLDAPTRSDLNSQFEDQSHTVKSLEADLNRLKQRGGVPEDIQSAEWILEQERKRQKEIKSRIDNGDFRETPPPRIPATLRQSSVDSDNVLDDNLTSKIDGLQQRIDALTQGREVIQPPPGWSPVGESIAGPFAPNVDTQTQTAEAAQQDINNRNEWEEIYTQQEIERLQNEMATLQGQKPPRSPSSTNYPPSSGMNSGYGTYGSPSNASQGESGHSHNSDGSDASSNRESASVSGIAR